MLKRIIIFCLILPLLLMVGACSKDNDGPEIEGNVGNLTMMVDGKPVSFKLAWVGVDYEQALEDGEDTFLMVAQASSVDISGKDPEKVNSESIIFSIEIPISKFRNPQGTYALGASHPGMMIYYKANSGLSQPSMSNLSMYSSVDIDDRSKKMGEFIIKSAKIGNQGLTGMGEGYTEIVATFNSDLVLLYDGQDPDKSTLQTDKLIVKDGKVTFKTLLSGLFKDLFK